jgi:hypothetical protein
LYETFDPPLRSVQAPGGSGPRTRLDDRAVKLVPAHPRPGRREHAVAHGHGLPIPEGQPLAHTGSRLQHAAHRLTVELTGEVEETGTFGGDGSAAEGEFGYGFAQGFVGGQLGGIHLREPTTDDQPGGIGGQLLVMEGVESDDFGSGGGEQFGMLGVGEGEGGPAGDGNDRGRLRRVRGCLPGWFL